MRDENNFKHNLAPNVATINLNVLRTHIKSDIVNDEDSGLERGKRCQDLREMIETIPSLARSQP